MNKYEFLYELNRNLYLLSQLERDDIIADYEEHFRIGIKDGFSEEEICERLGNPVTLANEFMSNNQPDRNNFTQPKSSYSPNPSFSSANANSNQPLISLLVVLFNIFIGIWIIVSVFATWISLWAASISVLVSGPIAIIDCIVNNYDVYLGLFISIGVLLFSLGILMCIGMVYLTKYMFIGLKKYFQLCSNLCTTGTFKLNKN